MKAVVAAVAVFCALWSSAAARLDLDRASVEKLGNGLTLIMLEDRTFPVVSVQTVYKTGAKDDPAGRLGLAHFMEHMAFRGSKNFPDTGLVDHIYDVGGEWHGYTWLDLTTYFATVPKENLDLLLDVESDRMARLELRKRDIEAERGAVLAEMNGYANDPSSVLYDALMTAYFLTHPYRNNSIGYETDVRSISHRDIVNFYAQHYAPGNAVIAIVGDFDRDSVRAAVNKKFGKIKKKIGPNAPLTAEIPRTGERRIRLSLPSEEKLFKIAYPAPAASDADFAAFLVLQALVGESSGVNFNQNDWGTPVGDRSPIASIANGVTTFFIPTAENYAFVISGSVTNSDDEKRLEVAFQTALDRLTTNEITQKDLAVAKTKVRNALVEDIQSTEDAAHQLAYFAGVGALDSLFALCSNVEAVSAEEVAAAARKYLDQSERTVAWLVPGPVPPKNTRAPTSELERRTGAPAIGAPAPQPILLELKDLPPLYFMRSDFSPTVTASALLAGRFDCSICTIDKVAFGDTSISASSVSGSVDQAIQAIAEAVKTAKPYMSLPPSDDPLTRIDQTFETLASSKITGDTRIVKAVAISGGADEAAAKAAYEKYFPTRQSILALFGPIIETSAYHDKEFNIDEHKAQTAVGYIATVLPNKKGALPAELALYVLTHAYGGRLGKEAISRRGLLYYIDSAYRPFRGYGFVTIEAGVDSDKADAFAALLREEVNRLEAEPPNAEEIAAAKQHAYGRRISAAQSNSEITEALLRRSLSGSALETPAEFKARLDAVTADDIREAAAELAKGIIVRIKVKSL